MYKLIAAAFAAVLAFACGAPAQAASRDEATVVKDSQASLAAWHRHYRRHYHGRHWRH